MPGAYLQQLDIALLQAGAVRCDALRAQRPARQRVALRQPLRRVHQCIRTGVMIRSERTRLHRSHMVRASVCSRPVLREGSKLQCTEDGYTLGCDRACRRSASLMRSMPMSPVGSSRQTRVLAVFSVGTTSSAGALLSRPD